MHYNQEEFINAIKVLAAEPSQVRCVLVERNQNDIFINGCLLKDISASDISSVWNHLFG